MAGQILIPFNPHHRIKETLAVVEETAKPGMRVVFLVRYPVGSRGMVPGSLDNNRIFETRHTGGKESHREILLGGAKGVGRRDGCSMALRFAKDRSKGDPGGLYRQFVTRGGIS